MSNEQNFRTPLTKLHQDMKSAFQPYQQLKLILEKNNSFNKSTSIRLASASTHYSSFHNRLTTMNSEN
jgi:hypothetical protein